MRSARCVAPLIDVENASLAQTLKREARGAQKLVLWLDCDREGENIAFEVIQICQEVNPRIQPLRAVFSSLVPRYALAHRLTYLCLLIVEIRDIMRAWENLGQPNKLESEAGALSRLRRPLC